MAKLPRIFNRLFASQAGATEIGQFGSLALGSPATTTSISAMQSLAPWLNGWNAAILGGNSPAIEDMNAIFRVLSYQLGYLMQAGVAEWDPTTTYYIGSYCQGVGTGILYRSRTDDNTNNAVGNNANWENLDLSTVPVGAGLAFHGSTPPDGFLIEDGSAISRTSFARLFSAIGTVNGVGDASTTFNIPDSRGKFLRGVSAGTGNDPDAASRTSINGGASGDNTGSIQSSQFGSHNHGGGDHIHNGLFLQQGAGSGGLVGGGPDGAVGMANSGNIITTQGGAETRPINLYVNWIIKY